ncbi:MAG: Phenylacetic acid catabolic protein [Gemmatimonadota bacterium]|nr:Phenylacetic acid catabolic protein [Gemmatimonadota bacterium]
MTAGTVLDLKTLDTETRSALTRHILRLADSKRLLGIRYSDWNLGAPTVETGIAMSSMTQDEWGHARLLYAMLKELDIDPVEVEHERPAEEYANIGSVDEPFPDWAATVAGIVVVDGALYTAIAAFARGNLESARNRCAKMIAEEDFHISLGAAWYRRLASSSDEAKKLLREATDRFLPEALAWLGTDDGPARTLVDAGGTEPGADQVTTFRDYVRDVLAAGGVDVDAVEPATDEWDAERGRRPGHPDQDTIERARGDRNRALFVE